jgi:Ca2+-binding EF-hand superfamily protein
MKQLILNEYNANATEEYLEEQMNIYDENNDGQFDFEEIVEAIEHISKEVAEEKAKIE